MVGALEITSDVIVVITIIIIICIITIITDNTLVFNNVYRHDVIRYM